MKACSFDSSVISHIFIRNSQSPILYKRLLSGKIKEFAFEGLMYDVIRVSKTPDGIQVECIADHLETKLIRQFLTGSELGGSNEPPFCKNLNRLKNQISGPYLFPQCHPEIEMHSDLKNNFPDVIQIPSIGFKDKILHPPSCVI